MRQLYWAVIFVFLTASTAVAASGSYLYNAIQNPTYLRALGNLINGSPNLPSWTKEVLNPKGNYVGDTGTLSTVDGQTYEMFHACEAHDCDNNQLEVMFASGGTKAWGALIVNHQFSGFIGAPSMDQQAALLTALNQG